MHQLIAEEIKPSIARLLQAARNPQTRDQPWNSSQIMPSADPTLAIGSNFQPVPPTMLFSTQTLPSIQWMDTPAFTRL